MLSKAEIRAISDKQKECLFYGTPEEGYSDSGLWKYLTYVYTKDSHSPLDPVRKILGSGDDYAIIVFLYMLACNDLSIPKSRQIRMSWFCAAFANWHTKTAKYRHTIWQGKKEQDAFAQTSMGNKAPTDGRIDFIEQHLPQWLRDPNIVSGKGNLVGAMSYTQADVSDDGVPIIWQGSKLNAVPQGAHQVRQYTPSLMIVDEAAFMEDYGKTRIAIKPAIHGGGKFISVSSVDAGSDFNQTVLDVKGGIKHEIHPIVKVGMEKFGLKWPRGMRSWKTDAGIWALEVHYSSDPKKDPAREGAAWVEEAVKGYVGGYESPGWQTEYEINYEAGGGDPVFPFLKPGCPIFIDGFKPHEIMGKMRFFAGYDYGSQNPSAFVVWAVDQENKAYSVWELYEPNTNMARHVEKIKRCPYWDRIEKIVCDPSIGYRTQHGGGKNASDIKTLIEIYEDHGLYMSPGRRGQDVTFAQMLKSSYWKDPDNPTLFLTKATPSLNKEWMGLRWDKHISDAVNVRKNAPEKIRDKSNHTFDASAVIFDDGVHGFVEEKVRKKAGTFMQAVEDLRLETAIKNRPTGGGINVL